MDRFIALATQLKTLRERVAAIVSTPAPLNGSDGLQGAVGASGKQGAKGEAGKDGREGDKGAKGDAGITGKQGVSVVDARIDADNSLVLSLSDGKEIDCGSDLFSNKGTVYNTTLAQPTGGTVTSVSVTTANGVSGSVATDTTTPAIALTLGAITPASVVAAGSVTGSNLSGANSGDNATNTQYSGLVTNATHTGDATGSTALTVVRLNGTSLAGLATGLLKNTTTTGVPSIAINSDLPAMSATVGGAVPTPPNNTTTFLRGDGTFATPVGGSGASLNAVSAAVATQAGIANANFNIRWNWAKTTNATAAFELGESVAATGGTSTTNIPDQYIAKFSTLAASTASAAGFYSRGLFVAGFSPTTRQMIFTPGSIAAPALCFTTDLSTGISEASGVLLSHTGTNAAKFSSTQACFRPGSSALPAITDLVSSNAGVFFSSAVFGVSVSATENSRFIAGAFQGSRGGTDAVSYAFNSRKSRGSVETPTVITTGDDLLTISGNGYVGATNTYQEAARITFDSTGVISDSATGIGGIIRFAVATVGAEPVEAMNITGTSLILAGTLRLKGYTVAGLPAGVQGDKAFVTNALAPTYRGGVTAGGTDVVEVFYTGTAWIYS